MQWEFPDGADRPWTWGGLTKVEGYGFMLWRIPRRLLVWTDEREDLDWDVTFLLDWNEDTQTSDITEITIKQRPGGPPATAGLRRIPFGALRTEVLTSSMDPHRIVDVDADGEAVIVVPDGYVTQSDGTLTRGFTLARDEDVRKVTRKKGTDRTEGRTRANAVTPEDLDEALAHYMWAKEKGRPDPMGYVAERIGRSRSTAGNWVKKAKEARS